METELKSTHFLEVVNSNKGIIYKVASLYCNDTEARKDLVQEIIIQLWRSYDNYDKKFKQSTWIYRISLNVAISFYRKEIRRKDISNPISKNVLSFEDTNHGSETESEISVLHQFISELKELDKALMLLYLDEKSYKEISEIMGISETNVATKIGRIKILLKQKFSSR
jgi:RNA polymerase sigma factor (sigma-70 family)